MVQEVACAQGAAAAMGGTTGESPGATTMAPGTSVLPLAAEALAPGTAAEPQAATTMHRPPGADAAQPTPEFWKGVITTLYAEQNPEKLKGVETLMQKYQGREQSLYLAICTKYKVAPQQQLANPVSVALS